MYKKRTAQLAVGVLLLAFVIGVYQKMLYAQEDTSPDSEGLTYVVTASNPLLTRQVTGDVTSEVQGVPASPVDAFTWDGEGATTVEGEARLEVNPATNTGELSISWTDEHGEWLITQTTFAPPTVPTGFRIGASAEETMLIEDDPVTHLVYLHGDTGAVDPFLPTLFAYVATWGPADVTLNGEPFENPFDGPAPQWFLHTMAITGMYDEGGTVRTINDEIYNPDLRAEGATDYTDLEYQIIFIDAPGPDVPENIPPVTNFAYHLVFEDVTIEVLGGQSTE